jgi:FKBP-type peptidyl-prolyl cis-trans isomerase
METSHTKKSTRIIIWVIAIVMAAGFLGSYFLVILENNNQTAQNTNSTQTNQSQTTNLPTDPTAFKVSGKVDALQITDEAVGTGTEVKAGDIVRVNYKLTNAQSGVKYDSSYDRGEPATLSLNQVIPAWQQGIPGMKVGGKRRLIVPASLGYGAQASGNIPANSDLVFEVELLAVNPSDASVPQ